MLVDLLGLSVLFEEAPQHTHPVYPKGLGGHARIRRTLSLADAAVPALATRLSVLAHARPRVHRHRLLDDQTVLDQLPDVLP
jgi:hypothetical protein